jgi:Tfp pilus assembly protein PilF
MVALALCGAIVLGGCGSSPVQNVRRALQSTGEPDLKAGIRNYDEGRLTLAAQNLNDALRAGLSEADEVTANKYLAFIACSRKRERQCRAYFLRALELKPDFDLSPAEAGHPMWGPVFKKLKERE